MKLNAVTSSQTLDEVIRTGENEKCHCPWTIMYAFIPPPHCATPYPAVPGVRTSILLIGLVLALFLPWNGRRLFTPIQSRRYSFPSSGI